VNEDPENIAAEAQRLIDHPLLNRALDAITQRLTDELLSEPPANIPLWEADKWRRDHIDSINAVRSIKDVIRTELMMANAAMVRSGGIA
jgi:hypothetical protein